METATISGKDAATAFMAGMVIPALVLVGWMFGAHALGAGPDVIFLAIPAFVITSGLLLWRMLIVQRQIPWSRLGLVAPRRSLLHLLWAAPTAIIGSALIAAAIGSALHLAPGGKSSSLSSGLGTGAATLTLTVLCTCIGVPLVEELVFRGAIYGWLNSRLGAAGAIVLTGIVFGVVHGDPQIMLYVVPLGIALSAARWWFGTTWASMVIHVHNNSLVALVLGLSVSRG